MVDHGITIEVVWSDVDCLEIKLSVRFDVWSGAERVYVTRDGLIAFAAALDAVAEGGNEATLDAGQPDLGYGRCRVFEYGGPRRLGLDVTIGHAGEPRSSFPDKPRELRVSLPIERGQLSHAAVSLREIVHAERGAAHVAGLPDWP